MATEYYGEDWRVMESLSYKLGIPYQDCQDWEFTQAQPERLGSWLAVFEGDSLTVAERTLLLSLLISSYRSGARAGLDQREHLPRLMGALSASADLRAKMDWFWWEHGDEEDRELISELFGRPDHAPDNSFKPGEHQVG